MSRDMTDRIAYARKARETIHAYIQKYPGKLGEDIAYNNIRINKEMVLRTLRHLCEAGLVRKEGNRQAARFYSI